MRSSHPQSRAKSWQKGAIGAVELETKDTEERDFGELTGGGALYGLQSATQGSPWTEIDRCFLSCFQLMDSPKKKPVTRADQGSLTKTQFFGD